ncbi:MAG: tRNA (guanine37-N1)-methyltransferase [Actinomycetota bacterium]|jgi:tRNA (guanine37-N1)-methyltransferase|nr:tRNA (guanine37-N1)-methyltransferase [Actinomycetota bacterium]
MRIDVVTLFPELFEAPLRTSLLGKAIASGLLEVETHDLRDHGLGKHRSVDDSPFGGGPGMVMRPEPIFEAVEQLRRADSRVVLLSPRGSRLDHSGVASLAASPHLILICGRYEGVDERVTEELACEELSIGDYVLAGGELPALVVIEAVSRLVPGVLGNQDSLIAESHSSGELEYPQYTRPAEWRGRKVPEILLSGDHGAIERWRRERAEEITRERGD